MKSTRTTVSLPADQLERLQKLADQHGLSLAWIIRQAVNEFLARTDKQTAFNPLATGSKDEG